MASTYTVKKGDTLGAIAKRFGTTVLQLVKLNKKVKDPNKIGVGWELQVKDAPPPPPPKESGGPIKKKKGGIGYQYGEKEDKIEVINPKSKRFGEAGALVTEKDWRVGTEGEAIKTPVSLTTQAQAAPVTIPAPPPTPFGDTAMGKAHSYLDPVAVLSGNSGVPNFQARPEDYVSTALFGLGAGGSPVMPRLGIQPTPPRPMAGTARDYAATSAAARGSPTDVNAPIRPTDAQARRLKTAIKGRTSKGQDFDPGLDTNYGLPNVRDPEPVLPNTGKIESPPVGARERVITVPEPLVVRASDMKTMTDWRNTLRSASDNTVVIDGASDFGFLSDRVVISKKMGTAKIDPEKVLDAYQTPILNPATFLGVLKHIGFKVQ